jgi:hypothetical protein
MTPPLTHAERGRLGGLATKRKYGTKHYSDIGKRGRHSHVERWFGGDAAAHDKWLGDLGFYRYVQSTGIPPTKFGSDFNRPLHPKQMENIDVPF